MTGALAACAEAEGWEGGRERERKEGVRTAVGECVCVEGAQGSAFFRVRARTPPPHGQIPQNSFSHSFPAPACHHITAAAAVAGPAGHARAPCAPAMPFVA